LDHISRRLAGVRSIHLVHWTAPCRQMGSIDPGCEDREGHCESLTIEKTSRLAPVIRGMKLLR
jgi:hypothetical protein